MGSERIRTNQFSHIFVNLPERHVGRTVESQTRESNAAEKYIQNKGPVVTDGDRDQAHSPEELRNRRRPRFDELPDLVYFVGKGRVSNACAELGARES